MTEPVSPASTNQAVALARVEREAERSVIRKRTAQMVVALSALAVIGFCGTGASVARQRSAEHALWVDFLSHQGEYDCCLDARSALGPEQPKCRPGVESLVKLYRQQRQGASTTALLAAWIEEATGVDPVPFTASPPRADEVDALVRSCADARRVAGIPTTGDDPIVVVSAGRTLRYRDEHADMVSGALHSKDFALAFAGIVAVSEALAGCRSDAYWAALMPTSGGALPDGARSTLHGHLLCLRRLVPLIEQARAAARTHELPLRDRAEHGKDIERVPAGFALALLGLDDEERTRCALTALGTAPGYGNAQSAPFLEEQIGRALKSTSLARQFLEDRKGDLRWRLRLQRAFVRNEQLRDDACRDLAQVAIDPALRGGENGVLAYAALDVPPVCHAALPIVLAGLASKDQGVPYLAAGELGKLGVVELPRLPPEQERALAGFSPNARDLAATRARAARVGVSAFVLGNADAMRGVEPGDELLRDLFR